jgi:hypothetical protein
MPLPDTLTREHVEQAIAQLDKGATHPFGTSTDYDLVVNGRAYPPKAVVGLAASLATGTPFAPSDFSGGEGPGQANGVLRSLGFTVERSGGNCAIPSRNRRHQYNRLEITDFSNFKTTAIDHSAIPPAVASVHHSACFGVAHQSVVRRDGGRVEIAPEFARVVRSRH